MIIKNHFHKKGFVLGLVLKQRLGASRKWPVAVLNVGIDFFGKRKSTWYTSGSGPNLLIPFSHVLKLLQRNRLLFQCGIYQVKQG